MTILPCLASLLLLAGPQDVDYDALRSTAADTELPDVELRDLAHWRELILPREEDLAYSELPWIADFATGLEEAARVQRPLLFWAMNGHPLGCT